MSRRLFNLLAGVSLVWVLGTGMLWVNSYHARLGYRWLKPSSSWSVLTVRGGFEYEHIYDTVSHVRSVGEPGWQIMHARDSACADRRFGFGWNQQTCAGPANTFTWHKTVLLIPAYALAALFSIAPAIWSGRRMLTRPATTYSCNQCGYDLRASPERCPECGAVPAGAKG